MKKTPHLSEDAEQIKLFNWIRLKEKEDQRYKMIVHVPNQGSAGFGGFIRQKKLKAMGVRKGFFDIIVICPSEDKNSNYIWPALFIELKTSKGKPSKEQLDWQMNLIDYGYCAEICYGGKEALALIQDWFSRTPWFIFASFPQPRKWASTKPPRS